MKIFREAILILGIYIIGEFISNILNIGIPGNILGMLLLLILLCTNIIKTEKIETLSNFFLDHLAFFFIPAGVGLLNAFTSFKDSFIPILLICILTTFIVILVTGSIVQYMIKKITTKKECE